jgi:hypothetical protein
MNAPNMNEENPRTDRWFTAAVVVISLAGILYFGIKAVFDGPRAGDAANPYAYDIEQFKRSGEDLVRYSEVRSMALPLTRAYALALGPSGEVFVSGDDSIVVLDSLGVPQRTLPMPGPVRCMAIDEGNGDLYAGLGDHVEVYALSGGRKALWESLGEKAILTSIAQTPDFVFAADAGNRIVWRFDRDGGRRRRIGEKDEAMDIPGFIIPSPFFDVAIDPDGFLWAANTGRHSLENYTLDGGWRSSWGEFAMDIEGFCGCCNPSHLAILTDGSFVTSEKGIPRVKVYDRLGRLSAVVAGPDAFEEGVQGLDLAVDADGGIYVLDPGRNSVRIFMRKEDP